MLKLGRNALADLKVFIDGNGDKIEWRFIQSLHEQQQIDDLKYGGNKLSNLHIKYHRHKMNVKIAAQTLSSSVADAVEFFEKEKHPNFKSFLIRFCSKSKIASHALI